MHKKNALLAHAMLFNSLSYALFLPIVFLLYWLGCRRSHALQNSLLLIGSYFFYACWDWRFLFLLVFSTLLDYFTGLFMHTSRSRNTRQWWLWLSIVINLGFLGVFKYYDFFAISFANFMATMGWQMDVVTLNVILPVGISFYTFHGLSYVLDVYSKRITAEKNFIDYALFVSFFPLLVAGPIERATHLLPQIKSVRSFNYSNAVMGLRQILWGLFKKIVIADQCAVYANTIFNHSSEYGGSTLLMGAILFAFQIYGDFSGYSDIALGSARLLGFSLLRNFAYPYFSRDMAEFWRRWHISLSSWFRDYLYIPLGGSNGGTAIRIRNTLIIFVVSGFWHGANFTFIVWGLLNALYIIPSMWRGTNRYNLEMVAPHSSLPSFKEFFQILLTFTLTVIAWIFFRAKTLPQAWHMCTEIFSPTLFSWPYVHEQATDILILPKKIFLLIFLFIAIEWHGRHHQFALQNFLVHRPSWIRWLVYYAIVVAIFLASGHEEQFIYFQF